MVHRSGDPTAYGEGLKNLTPEELQELDQLVTPRLAQLLTKAYPDAGPLLAPFIVGDIGAGPAAIGPGAGPAAIGPPQAAPPIRPPVAIPPTAGAAPPVTGSPVGAPIIGAGRGIVGPPRTALRRVGRV